MAEAENKIRVPAPFDDPPFHRKGFLFICQEKLIFKKSRKVYLVYDKIKHRKKEFDACSPTRDFSAHRSWLRFVQKRLHRRADAQKADRSDALAHFAMRHHPVV